MYRTKLTQFGTIVFHLANYLSHQWSSLNFAHESWASVAVFLVMNHASLMQLVMYRSLCIIDLWELGKVQLSMLQICQELEGILDTSLWALSMSQSAPLDISWDPLNSVHIDIVYSFCRASVLLLLFLCVPSGSLLSTEWIKQRSLLNSACFFICLFFWDKRNKFFMKRILCQLSFWKHKSYQVWWVVHEGQFPIILVQYSRVMKIFYEIWENFESLRKVWSCYSTTHTNDFGKDE